MKDFAVILSISMKGFVWRWMVALCVFTEIVAAQNKVASGNERNVAPKGTCSSSTVFKGETQEGAGLTRSCNWIINEDPVRTNWGRNCFSTDDGDPFPRLTVILRDSYYIHKLVLYSRKDFEGRMLDVEVFFDGVPVYKVREQQDVIPWEIPENSRRYARNVTLYKRQTGSSLINFCELQIYTCKEGLYGPRCDQPCTARMCADCKDNRLGNVAPKGTCSSSTISNYTGWPSRTCYAVLNGNKTSANDSDTNCFETLQWDEYGSFTVTLRHSYFIHRVLIYARSIFQLRIRGVQVLFDGVSVYTVSETSEHHVIVVNNLEPRETSNVTLFRTRGDGSNARPMISLCELEIYTCIAGKWGPCCDKDCADQCAECKGSSDNCLECKEGFWGPNTCAKCGEGCVSGNCSFANGTCQCRESQQQHWEPPKCERCSKDYWGANCTHECSKTCSGTDQEGYCDNTTGKCLKGCSAGYWGDNCSATCGQGCGNTCNAKDGTCYCQVGWKPPKCEVPSCTCGGAGCEGDNKYVFSELSRKINVAVGKNSIASTTLKAPKPVSGPACLANNGKTESTMVAIPSSAPECMSTAEGDLKPFWQVDLGEQYVVAGILIEWDNQMKSLFGIRVLLDGKQLYYSDKPMTNPTELAANDLGQVVRLQREKFQDNKEWDDPLLRICEVEVYTCRPGYYGFDCQGICERPVCENLQICSRIDGSCPKDHDLIESGDGHEQPTTRPGDNAPVEELDCSKLIIVAGCFVHVLVVALFILAAKVLPRKKRSGTKPGNRTQQIDQTKGEAESKEDKGDDKGEQSSQGVEAESGEAPSVEEAESQM